MLTFFHVANTLSPFHVCVHAVFVAVGLYVFVGWVCFAWLLGMCCSKRLSFPYNVLRVVWVVVVYICLHVCAYIHSACVCVCVCSMCWRVLLLPLLVVVVCSITDVFGMLVYCKLFVYFCRVGSQLINMSQCASALLIASKHASRIL